MIAPTYYLCDVHLTTSPMLEKVAKNMNPCRFVDIPNRKNLSQSLGDLVLTSA